MLCESVTCDEFHTSCVTGNAFAGSVSRGIVLYETTLREHLDGAAHLVLRAAVKSRELQRRLQWPSCHVNATRRVAPCFANKLVVFTSNHYSVTCVIIL